MGKKNKNQNPQINKNLTYQIEITKTIQVPKTCKYTTRVSADTLEDAFEIARDKTNKLCTDGAKYVVTAVTLVY